MIEKLCTLQEAVARIPDHACVGLGGNTLNRAPMAAVFELIRQGRTHLHLVKTAGGMDIDALCLAGCAETVDAGFISYESRYGLAQHYRRAVQSGRVQAHEHACYTVISALRAASYGIPFMPVRGLRETDLRGVNDYFADVRDPFSGETLAAVRALHPDYSILHVHSADRFGNAVIEGPKYDDVLLSRASAKVIVTAERIVPDAFFSASPVKADIPHFLVSAVVPLRRGAQPCACMPDYGPDDPEIRSFLALADREALLGWLERRHV